jgi:hypothetical protein
VDFPIENGGFPFFVSLPEGNSHGNAPIFGWFPQFLMEKMIIKPWGYRVMAPNTT